MSIRVYTGEFLTSPVPLHLDMNWCSHGCFYCFANLNQPNRLLDASFLRPMVKALSTNGNDDEPAVYWLARRGYPILASNTVDPLARSNCEQFKEIHDALSDFGCRFTYQTKGGDHEAAEKALSDKPTMFYVSLTSDNDKRLKEQEPGAPPHRARLEFMAEAKRRGHHVVAGVNPMVPEWWMDTDKLIDDLLAIGVRHMWLQPIHLSRHQVSAMPANQRKRFAKWIEYAMKKIPPDALTIGAFMRDARNAGIQIFGDDDSPFAFWDSYFELGFPFWPTLTGWFKHLVQVGGGLPVIFSLDDFASWCDVGLPAGKAWYKEFVQPFGRTIRNKIAEGETWRKAHECPRSLREALAVIWRWYDYPTVMRSGNICAAMQGEDIMLDDNGEVVMVFVPEEHEHELFDITACRTVRYPR